MELKHNVARVLKNNPDRIIDIVEEIYEQYGEGVKQFFTCHIENLDTYNKYVSLLKNFDGSIGGHWNIEQIKSSAKIDWDKVEYTCYDYAYIVNMKYSDDGHRFKSVDDIFASAKDFLEDNDCGCEPSERAYWEGKKRYEFYKRKK